MDKIKIGKLNLFDILIIALIICCVIFAIFKLLPKSSSDSMGEKANSFSYVIKVEGISETSGEMIKVGDELFDKVSSSNIGKIKEIKIEPAKVLFESKDGTISRVEMPTKIDVELVVETNGKISNGEYTANGLIRILVGQTKQVKTKYWMASGVVTEILENT